MSNQQFIHLKLWFPHTELGSSCNSLSFKSQFVGLPLNLEVISGTRSGLDRVLDLVLQTGLDRVLDLVLQKGSDQVLDLGKL